MFVFSDGTEISEPLELSAFTWFVGSTHQTAAQMKQEWTDEHRMAGGAFRYAVCEQGGVQVESARGNRAQPKT